MAFKHSVFICDCCGAEIVGDENMIDVEFKADIYGSGSQRLAYVGGVVSRSARTLVCSKECAITLVTRSFDNEPKAKAAE